MMYLVIIIIIAILCGIWRYKKEEDDWGFNVLSISMLILFPIWFIGESIACRYLPREKFIKNKIELVGLKDNIGERGTFLFISPELYYFYAVKEAENRYKIKKMENSESSIRIVEVQELENEGYLVEYGSRYISPTHEFWFIGNSNMPTEFQIPVGSLAQDYEINLSNN